MSKVLCASLAHKFHITLGEVGMGECGVMYVEGEDERIGEVDEKP
jgi:hypothetical protein